MYCLVNVLFPLPLAPVIYKMSRSWLASGKSWKVQLFGIRRCAMLLASSMSVRLGSM